MAKTSEACAWLCLAAAVAASTSCTQYVDDEASAGDASPAEPLGTDEEAATFEDYAVGIIPAGPGGAESGLYGSCPSGFSMATLYMDDEDHLSATQWGWSWRKPTDTEPDLRHPSAQMNTTLRFCKVNGLAFRPLTTDPFDRGRFYAVLKLGQFCPNGSIEFSRYFDNEDDRNENFQDGPIAPNLSGDNTTLRFCFFTTGTTTMSSFPTAPFSYAVYHDFDGPQPAPFNVAAKAKHYSDDEDDRNENSMSGAGSAFYNDFRAVISDGPNTTFDLARVR